MCVGGESFHVALFSEAALVDTDTVPVSEWNL